MAPTSTTKDPIVSVEGMFRGSLARLGDFFKNPKLYGGATLLVLKETAKRYDDALDDCVIQIQQAKWLLEYELEQNRARRAEKAAAEELALKKRKAETAPEAPAVNMQAGQVEASPNKKTKIETSPAAIVKAPEQSAITPSNQPPNQQPSVVVTQNNIRKVVDPKVNAHKVNAPQVDTPKVDAPKVNVPKANAPKVDTPKAVPASTAQSQTKLQPSHSKNKSDVALSVADKVATKKSMAEAQPVHIEPQRPKDKIESQPGMGETEQSPQNDEYFDSMFADATAGSDQNNSLDFNMEMGAEGPESSVAFGSAPVPGSSNNLELLAGLESYANATGDDFTMLNNPSSVVGDQPDAQASGKGFELPDMTTDNTFDDLLTDDTFGADNAQIDLDLDGGFFSSLGNDGNK